MSGYHKNEVYALLNDKGIPYEAVEHEAVFTMEEMERAGIDAYGCICKNLFLRDAKGRQHYLVTVPDERRVDLKWLSAALGSSTTRAAPLSSPQMPRLRHCRRSAFTRTIIPLRYFFPLPISDGSLKRTATASFSSIFPSARRKRDLPPRSRHAQCRKRGFLRQWDFSDFYNHFFPLLKNLMYIFS